MEKRAMAVREEQWIQAIAAAKQSDQPIKACPADCAKFRSSISGTISGTKSIDNTETSGRILLHIQNMLVELPAGTTPEQINVVISGIRHAE